jgi:hydroxymethylbilane synthase
LAATCNLPIAAFAEIREGEIYLSSFVSDNDGGRVLKADLSGPLGQGAQLAEQIAVTLLEQGAQELIQGIAPAG